MTAVRCLLMSRGRRVDPVGRALDVDLDDWPATLALLRDELEKAIRGEGLNPERVKLHYALDVVHDTPGQSHIAQVRLP